MGGAGTYREAAAGRDSQTSGLPAPKAIHPFFRCDDAGADLNEDLTSINHGRSKMEGSKTGKRYVPTPLKVQRNGS